MIRLKSTRESPPGGFLFKDPGSGWAYHSWSYRQTVNAWHKEKLRLNKPDASEQSAARDVETYTCKELLKHPHWSNWVIMDKPYSIDEWAHNRDQATFRADQPCFIQLGRCGDLILLLPAFQHIHRTTGKKPVVIVSRDYADLFDGVSYATALSVPWKWYQGIPQARALAQDIFGAYSVTQCHGLNWGVDMSRHSSFQESMWSRTGVAMELMPSLLPEFDRRDPVREKELVARVRTVPHRKIVLTKFSGVSSPFPHTAAVSRIVDRWFGHAQIVSLDLLKAERIYDLLGLFEAAAGIVTIDTSILHLAAASKTPYVAFKTEGWNGSIPKGNCAFHCRYHEVPQNLDAIDAILRLWIKG